MGHPGTAEATVENEFKIRTNQTVLGPEFLEAFVLNFKRAPLSRNGMATRSVWPDSGKVALV